MTKIDIGIRLPPKSSRIWDSLYLVERLKQIWSDPESTWEDPDLMKFAA